MDEARRVIERLRRIELLDAEGAAVDHVLAEVRALVAEAAAWLRVETDDTARALEALGRCEDELARRHDDVAETTVPLLAR